MRHAPQPKPGFRCRRWVSLQRWRGCGCDLTQPGEDRLGILAIRSKWRRLRQSCRHRRRHRLWRRLPLLSRSRRLSLRRLGLERLGSRRRRFTGNVPPVRHIPREQLGR
jgi:hypothetical protein